MPRKNLIRTDLYYYHITTRSNHREWFEIPLDEVWEIAAYSINKANLNCPSEISQFVLMANHYHLLIKTPNSDIDRFMFWFNKTFSDLLRAKSGKINRMFGSNYKWCLVTSHLYLCRVVVYIYQNPLQAGLVKKCSEYPYSTLYYQERGLEVGFDLHPVTWNDDNDFFAIEENELLQIR